MSLRPRISVIIPTYNRSFLLRNAIKSVLAQTYADYEIVVVDDGSTEDIGQVVDHYQRQSGDHGCRFQYIRQQNLGVSLALNNGIERARGEWIAVLASDDIWLPDKLEWQLRAVRQFGNQCHACFTDARYVNNPHLRMTAFDRRRKRLRGTMGIVVEPFRLFLSPPSGVYVQTLIVRTELIGRVGGFDPKLRIGEDTDFLFRLGLATNFCYVNKPLVEIDRTPSRADGLTELTAKDHELRLQHRQYIYEKWLGMTGDRGNRLRKRILGRLADIYIGWANYHLINEDYNEARCALSKALHIRFKARDGIKWLLTKVAPRTTRKVIVRREAERERRQVVV